MEIEKGIEEIDGDHSTERNDCSTDLNARYFELKPYF